MHYIWLSVSDNKAAQPRSEGYMYRVSKPRGLVLLRPDLGRERRGSLEAPCGEELAWGTCHLPLHPRHGSLNSPSVTREKGNKC